VVLQHLAAQTDEDSKKKTKKLGDDATELGESAGQRRTEGREVEGPTRSSGGFTLPTSRDMPGSPRSSVRCTTSW